MMEPINGVLLALTLGATFVARSFSGDKAQLVPIIKAGLQHKGFAFIDVVSPCVTFNDHDGSTKSYAYMRERQIEVVATNWIPHRRDIEAEYEPGTIQNVRMHDGSVIKFRKVAAEYDPFDRDKAYAYIRERRKAGEVVTGLLYISPDSHDMVEQNAIMPGGLCHQPYEKLCPGSEELAKLQNRYR